MTSIQNIRDLYEKTYDGLEDEQFLLRDLGAVLHDVTGPDGEPRSRGAELVLDERIRQVDVEGYSPRHDAGHEGDLICAAIGYASYDHGLQEYGVAATTEELAATWPWAPEFWKPTGDRVRDLTKAAALLVAAIDAELERQDNA